MGELLDRLKELEDVSTWIRDVALRDIQIHAIVPWEELPEEYRNQETMEPETVEDTMHNSGFYVTLPDGQAYCLREQGISSVQGRAGITGQAYRRLSKEKTAQHLNDGLSVTDIGKKCYIRNEGGKILSIHSDEYNPFNTVSYTHLDVYKRQSKETAGKIKKLRHGKLGEKYRNYLLNGDERGKFGMLSKKWQYLADTTRIPEDISDVCCEILKKKPFKKYVKETSRYPFMGITQDESFRRENQYNHTGCNVYDGSTIKSQPIGFWTKQDILRYKVEKEIPICSVYGCCIKNKQGVYVLTGEQRTGCVVCGFGCHLESEPNRIQRLRASDNERHRTMCERTLQITNNGVTYMQALNDCGIPTTTWELEGQMNIYDFPEFLPDAENIG